MRAAAGAEPTPGARELLQASADTARTAVVISNNSAEAIAARLRRQRLDPYVSHTEGTPLRSSLGDDETAVFVPADVIDRVKELG